MNVKNTLARGQHKSSMSIRPRPHQLEIVGESMTDQSFARDCDLKVIINKFTKGSLTPEQLHRAGQYGDFVDAPDFVQAQNTIAELNTHFAELPSKLRDRFENSVEQYLDFVHDSDNRSEMTELGLNTDHFPPVGDAHLQTDIEDTPDIPSGNTSDDTHEI